ncbi:MAG: alkaline phosphatase D family protein [Blastocatellia bacterium]
MNQSIVDRRRFLIGGGALSGLALMGRLPSYAQAQAPKFTADPFSLGVASGDPLPDGVVLWTRLAPDPLNGGGMPRRAVTVKWEIAADEQMKKIVRRGSAVASPELGHSVHVEAQGLEPARWYWYRFMAGSVVSPVGRTRTAPALNARLDRLRFAFASCQHYETGFFTAYKHMADEDLDLVAHLGDYIYEGAPAADRPRRHNSPEIISLEDYRNRYALYKSDPDLKLAHAAFPWIVTWDDHEVDNNYAGDVPEDKQSRRAFLERRAHAYQAYYEHMPLRRSSLPRGSDMRLYRRLRFGDLAEFNVLDTRQYRSDQPCGDGRKSLCPEVLNPRATMLGARQEQWLFNNLDKSKTRWNVMAQQVMVAKWDLEQGPELRMSMDKWCAYPAALNRFMNFLRERKPSNPVVITGDIHSNWVADLKADFDNPGSAIVGTEFVGTSITSGGDGVDMRPDTERQMGENPHVKFFNSQRGYVRCDVNPNLWRTDFRIVAAVTKPSEPISTRASFVVENGKPGTVSV